MLIILTQKEALKFPGVLISKILNNLISFTVEENHQIIAFVMDFKVIFIHRVIPYVDSHCCALNHSLRELLEFVKNEIFTF